MKATVLEILRMGNVVPIPAPRCTTKDIEFKEYLIPKVSKYNIYLRHPSNVICSLQDSVLFYNLYAMYNDKSYWEDPKIFRPERFLNECGEVDQLRSERILNTVFGVGNLYKI